MQPSTASAPPAMPSFAGILADATIPELKFPPARDLDGLEPDIATLSYEHALHRHARRQSEGARQIPQVIATAAAKDHEGNIPASQVPASHQAETCRKSASLTLRLTAPESERVRLRAAEAELNVSEYVRSCVFEVETLRSQVKEMLTALRRSEDTRSEPRTSWWARIVERLLRKPQSA